MKFSWIGRRLPSGSIKLADGGRPYNRTTRQRMIFYAYWNFRYSSRRETNLIINIFHYHNRSGEYVSRPHVVKNKMKISEFVTPENLRVTSDALNSPFTLIEKFRLFFRSELAKIFCNGNKKVFLNFYCQVKF